MKTENLSREQQQIENLWQVLNAVRLMLDIGKDNEVLTMLPEIKETLKNNKPTN